MPQQAAPMPAFTHNRETAPAYWMIDILWLVLVDGEATNGAYSLIEQQMRGGSGPPVPHIHSIDEWFYVLEGELTMTTGDRTFPARAGDSVWIPRGTVHHFKVTSAVCRALNAYTPAGFEQVIKGLARPAERRELPPSMDPPDQVTIDKIFNNYWTAEASDPWSMPPLGPSRVRA